MYLMLNLMHNTVKMQKKIRILNNIAALYLLFINVLFKYLMLKLIHI